MIVLDKFSSSIYPPLTFQGEALFLRKELIEAFIRKNLPSLDFISLAKTKLTEDKIEFFTDLQDIFLPIEDFALNKKNEILQRYNKAIYSIQDFLDCYSKIDSSEIIHWKTILNKIYNPANNVIYSNGESIILLWGCNFFNEQVNYLSREQVAGDNDLQIFENEHTDVISELSATEDLKNHKQNIEEIALEETLIPTIESTQNASSSSIFVRSNKKNQRGFINRFFIGFIDFVKRSWWFILLLLFLAIWLNDCNYFNCSDDSLVNDQEKEEAKSFLPHDQGIAIPIKSTEIGYDRDSMFLIANNRVNVALKSKQSDFFEFVNDLGKSFLNNSREIIYYDEATARIQLKFNQNSDSNIKDKIRSAVPNYDLLIWDESIFTSSLWKLNDPLLSQPSKNWYLKAIHMDKAWNITTGKSSVTVAVVDNGFDLTHSELRKTRIVRQYNIANKNNQVYGNVHLSHGTHVATILLGSANNNVGLAGIAPNVSFMPVQIGNETRNFLTSTEIIDGVLYALKNKADVINLSIGKQFSPQIEALPVAQQQKMIQSFGKDEEEFWTELFEIADKQNTTIVIAAGNSGVLSGIDPMHRHPNTIIVGAVDTHLKLAKFSNYGQYNTINAPGVNIVSAIPGNTFKAMDGTSMAAPIISGAVALLKSIKPHASNNVIKQKLIKSTQKEHVVNVENLLTN